MVQGAGFEPAAIPLCKRGGFDHSHQPCKTWSREDSLRATAGHRLKARLHRPILSPLKAPSTTMGLPARLELASSTYGYLLRRQARYGSKNPARHLAMPGGIEPPFLSACPDATRTRTSTRLEPNLVTPASLELATCRLGNDRSIHLSYGVKTWGTRRDSNSHVDGLENRCLIQSSHECVGGSGDARNLILRFKRPLLGLLSYTSKTKSTQPKLHPLPRLASHDSFSFRNAIHPRGPTSSPFESQE